MRRTAAVSTLALAIALTPAAATAQSATNDVSVTDPVAASDAAGDSGEIVVTAQRRAERLVDVPITVTTLGAEQLTTANVRELGDIAKVTPALRFDTAGAFAQPTIRGIGTAVTTSGGGANVGIYIDGFYSPNPLAANAQLLNVQSVQVLKGPQGTLFGRNTTGGAILIQSAEPSETPAAQVKASYARYDQVQTQGYATLGVAPGIAFDVEGRTVAATVSHTNLFNGDKNVGRFENWLVRTGLKVEISPDVSLLLRYQHGDVDDPTSLLSAIYVDPVLGRARPIAPPASFTTAKNAIAADRPLFFRSKNDTVQATLKADLGFADLVSYSQYRREKSDASFDLDRTALTVFQFGLPVINRTYSQEFLLNSKPGGRLQWTTGLFYFSNQDRYITFIDNAGSSRNRTGPTRIGGSSTTTRSYAAFADATYEAATDLFVTAGLRYAHDAVVKAYYNLGPAEVPMPSIKDDRITPRVVLRYKPTDRASVYASYTRGYKASVIDVGGSCQNPPAFRCNAVQPEEVDAFEVGAKYDDRRLAVEAAAFYYDYKNLQISSFLADGRANIANAAKSEIYGAEGSLRYELTDDFEVNAGASYTHARYKRFVNAPIYVRCPGWPGAGQGTSFFLPFGTTLRNVTMQRTPEFTGNIGARYKTPLAGGNFQLSGNLYYTSKFFFGPSGIQFAQKGYELASARAQWTDPSDRYTVAVFGDNLTNRRFLTAVQYNSFSLGANWNVPITYGIELGAKF